MKRVWTVLVVLALCVSLAGCRVLEYHEASTLYDNEQYLQAQAAYEALGDFADSAEMAQICRQKNQYTQAETLFADGEYEQAAEQFESLGMYSDSPLRAVQCRYAGGAICLEKGDYPRAIALLTALGGYEDSAELVKSAKWKWLSQQRPVLTLPQEEGTLAIEPEEDALRIVLEKNGQILALPNHTTFSMTLLPGETHAAYTLSYTSTNISTITETVCGSVQLQLFEAGLPVESYTRTVTDTEGNAAETPETSEAIMMQPVMTEVVMLITENLPALLEDSGVPVTVSDLGF